MIIKTSFGEVEISADCSDFNTKFGSEFVCKGTGVGGKVIGTGPAICGRIDLWVTLENKDGYFHITLDDWLDPDLYEKV
jgi:hypothetical protein